MHSIMAKSNGETLEDHTSKCIDVFGQMIEVFPDLDVLTNHPNIYIDIFNALFFHDFGKAAKGFQRLLNDSAYSWGYRHEILSVPFVDHLDIQDNTYTKLMILTHHKDLDELKLGYDETELVNLGMNTDFDEKMKEIEPNLGELDSLLQKMYPEVSRNMFGSITCNTDDITDIPDTSKRWENLLSDYNLQKYSRNALIFGKGLVNSCDYLASAGFDRILNPLKNMEYVYSFPNYNSIQKQCLSEDGDAIMVSPTGSGKTEASLFWATNNLNDKGTNRIFYTLPYTASINKMYERLTNSFSGYYEDDAYVSMLHGSAAYYLHENYEKSTFDNLKALARKIYSPYKLITPFQSLKHLFTVKGYEMGLLEMYHGNFIFDEIHTYDARNVGLIYSMCEYLTNELDANIMMMSATMPDFLKDKFADLLGVDSEINIDENEKSKYLRHRCQVLDGNISDNLDKVIDRIRNGEKVLVVCNTVKKSQEIYKTLCPEANTSALLHSRFTLGDREQIEKNLEGLNLLVGTQAIEVSLDISYDVCFTEPAPIDALIQRFGRVNRWKDINGYPLNGICDVYVFSEMSDYDSFIYSSDIVNRTIDSLSSVEYLDVDTSEQIVNDVYKHGFSKQDDEEFRDTSTSFRKRIENIEPLKHSDMKESDFLDLFDSIEAVPVKYKDEYFECINNKRIYDAMKYQLKLHTGLLKKLKNRGLIDVHDGHIIVNTKYDNNFGLLDDIPEPDENIF